MRKSSLTTANPPRRSAAQPVGTSNAPESMMFPLARSGDLAYDVVLNHHAVDGSVNFGADAVQDGG